jgi:hypothetical protein
MEIATRDRISVEEGPSSSSVTDEGGGEELAALKLELFGQAIAVGSEPASSGGDQEPPHSEQGQKQGQREDSADEDSESELNVSCVSMSDVLFPQFEDSVQEEPEEGGERVEHAMDVSSDVMELEQGLSLPLTPSAVSAPQTVVVYFRVAFMGCLEYADEWLEAYSGAIRQCASTSTSSSWQAPEGEVEVSHSSLLMAPLGRRAQQHRGYYHSRPEMKYRVDLHRVKLQQEAQAEAARDQDVSAPSPPLALSPHSTLISPFYARVVDAFLMAGGMSAILRGVCQEGRLAGLEKVLLQSPEQQSLSQGQDEEEDGDESDDAAAAAGRAYISRLTREEKEEPPFYMRSVFEPATISSVLTLLSSFTSMSEVRTHQECLLNE